ncbi:uncharacterized protein FIBRA_09095 [Fibroporia radiculosa]|uniref:Uncharacterized protein n=1 Tax=Fibroporia radiculosa TaxID=599839 RepID=J4GXX5_9APHY|nr:uncharacterized protein FIBRA_09095 [Fibroporia radiculosa]CCM06795.1 predicted protein [Fibroporia radiculosa]
MTTSSFESSTTPWTVSTLINPVESIVADNTLVLTTLLGLLLITLLSVLSLALTFPLLLHINIKHLAYKHQWAFNIAATVQCPLQPTVTHQPIITTHCNQNQLGGVYFEYIKDPSN